MAYVSPRTDAYSTPDWEKLGLLSEPVSVFCMPIKSRPSATCVPVLDDKPRSRADEKREYNRLYQAKYRHLPKAKEVRKQRMALKRAAERVNPERSHSYTQADSDKTKVIAGKPNHRRSA